MIKLVILMMMSQKYKWMYHCLKSTKAKRIQIKMFNSTMNQKINAAWLEKNLLETNAIEKGMREIQIISKISFSIQSCRTILFAV